MSCRIPVHISQYWTIALAIRCEGSEQIYALSVIEEVDFKKPKFNIIAAPVEKLGNNVVYVKVMPWSRDGRYRFDSPPGRPVCSTDPLALGVKVNGQVLLMTQHGGGFCNTTFEPPMTDSNSTTQRWMFSSEDGAISSVCYSWEYTLLGGKNLDEAQVLQCILFKGDAAHEDPAQPLPSSTRLDAAKQETGQNQRTAQQQRLANKYGNWPSNRAPSSAQTEGVSDKIWECTDIQNCPPRDAPEASVYLVSVATKGLFQSCFSASGVPKFYVTPVPFNVFTECDGRNMQLNIKDAISLYREPYVFQKGCATEPLRSDLGNHLGDKPSECLFIALDDCSGYKPLVC